MLDEIKTLLIDLGEKLDGNNTRWLKPKEAEKYSKMSRNTMKRHIENGDIYRKKINGGKSGKVLIYKKKHRPLSPWRSLRTKIISL